MPEDVSLLACTIAVAPFRCGRSERWDDQGDMQPVLVDATRLIALRAVGEWDM